MLLPGGTRRFLSAEETAFPETLPAGSRVYTLDNLMSQSVGRDKGFGASCWFEVALDGKRYLPNERSRWKTNESGMESLAEAGRLEPAGNTLRYVRFLDDFPLFPVADLWQDTGIAGFRLTNFTSYKRRPRLSNAASS